MDCDNPSMECEVCGGKDFHAESGHFYCNECQTQSQQVQEHVFEQDDGAVNIKSTKKIQKKSQESEDKLTSWECFNYILKGLTEELIELGAKPELKVVVRCLWMKYLHKCEVFDINSDRPPKLSILGPKKDAEILYNVRKRKRCRSRTSSTSTTLSVQRQRSSKKRALIHSQYEELSQSQTLTQESSVLTDTLSTVKSGSETSESSGKFRYNRFSNRELKRMMSTNHRKKHQADIGGEMTCHKLRAKSFRSNFMTGPTNLTSFTLYGILYIALLIIGDSIQLGDMLRFIREGHLSFGCYRHFFDENISNKALNLPQRKEKLFSHGFFRKRCAKIALFLDVAGYMEKPDLLGLCSRYCAELNLPHSVFECAKKLILKSAPKMTFNKRSKTIPNYEARAMSFVLFSLKLLFGLDGVTEKRLSEYAEIVNEANDGARMFHFLHWLQFVGYRNAIVKLHHLPTSLRQCDSVDSDVYLNYLKKQDIQFKGSSRPIHSEVKDYLLVLDKICDGEVKRDDGIVFEPSLTPFLAYTKLILDSTGVHREDILQESFAGDSLEYLLRPEAYLRLAGNRSVINGGANRNIVCEDLMYLYKATIFAKRKDRKTTVAVQISPDIDEDKYVGEYLESAKTKSLMTTDVNVLLSNWQKGNEKEFRINQDQLKVASNSAKIGPTKHPSSKPYSEHYNSFERYWMNIPTNPVSHYFPKQDMDNILAKFPRSFRTVLSECSRVVEQDACDFFSEFLVSELYLAYFTNFGCKSKKEKSKGIHEIRQSLASCAERW